MTQKTAVEIGELVAKNTTDIRTEWARLSTLQRRIEGKLTRTWMPENADLEYRDLFTKASSPWLLYVRDVIAQGCRVDGYSNEQVWREAWQANGMDGRQGDVNREAIGLGKSFVMHMPTEDNAGVAMRPMSALTTFAVYENPWDEYPEWVLYRAKKRKGSFWSADWYFFDDTAMYRFTGDPTRPENMTVVPHGLDFTPVVMIANTLAIDGEPKSSIEPAISVYRRIVDATFTLQMLQRYGAFPQKWMAGGEIATDEKGNPDVRVAVDSLMHASGENGEGARFGSFAAASLTEAVAALEAHIKHLSALCQVPPHYLLGAVINMSADGIAAAEAGYFRNIADRKSSLGEGYELSMRTAAAILGLTEAADDTASQVHWADEATHSLAQISDAIVKLATVGAPLELLFAMIPGWSQTDIAGAVEAARQRQAQQSQQALQQAQRPPISAITQ